MPIIVFICRFIFAIFAYPGLLKALYGIYWLYAHLQACLMVASAVIHTGA